MLVPGGCRVAFSQKPAIKVQRMTSNEQKKSEFLPKIAQCFADNGYRGTTTAKLAETCKVRENVLYRIWPSKKEMFLECIEHIYEVSMALWNELEPEQSGGKSRAELILHYQAKDHGLLRYYRLVFAALMEDDPDIRKALRHLYRRFQKFLAEATLEHRESRKVSVDLDCSTSAWAIMGIAAMVDIQRELRILPAGDREEFLINTGMQILEGGNH